MYGKGECVYWMKNSSEVVQEVKVSSIGDMTRFKTGRDVRQGMVCNLCFAAFKRSSASWRAFERETVIQRGQNNMPMTLRSIFTKRFLGNKK